MNYINCVPALLAKLEPTNQAKGPNHVKSLDPWLIFSIRIIFKDP